ncbi:DNA-dependent ATPase protein rad54 [Puccinia graminis f. sp. tritici]|uniref:DNA-dependent ATPase protein rad54 n=1 Tax=Puccinia graminis f. sp. tritici TaxID=56615 RepID=A0A5B0SLN8_PUCGR|nr:DNA-dependent ATPase protein rad54 [Puccinia graminis f. sp. tritici]
MTPGTPTQNTAASSASTTARTPASLISGKSQVDPTEMYSLSILHLTAKKKPIDADILLFNCSIVDYPESSLLSVRPSPFTANRQGPGNQSIMPMVINP